ncbi:MAG: tetratricopeptide repeat protein [Myxococcota bacterium]|nr:tetratricopeptide repeat protein [Myxococcota bacterium]
MLRRILLLLFFIATFPNVASAQIRLAVLEFRGVEVKESLLRVLSDKVRSGVLHVSQGQQIRGEKLIIMTRENMQQVLQDQGLSAEDCKGECEVQLAKNIGADYVISGELIRLDELYVLTVKMHETQDSNLLGSETVETEQKRELLSGAQTLGSRIFQRALKLGDLSSMHSDSLQTGFSGGEDSDWNINPSQKKSIIQFESDPEGAAVLLNGNLICNSTPCSKAIDGGRYKVSIQKERYFPWEDTLVTGRTKRLLAELRPTFGYLQIPSNQSGIRLLLDGKQELTIPLQTLEIDAGLHKITVNDPCFQGPDYTFQLKAGRTERIENYPIKARRSGIEVSVKDQDDNDLSASVMVDGQRIGISPGTFEVPLCSKEILVEFKEKQERQSLRLREKQVKKVDLVLAIAKRRDKATTKRSEPRNIPRRTFKKKKVNPQQARIREATHEKMLELISMYEETLENPEIQGHKRAELIFRLSEKYFEEGRYYHSLEEEDFQVRYEECQNTRGCDVNRLQSDNARSSSWKQKAINSYTSVLRDYPTYPRSDEVLFYLGSAYLDMEQEDRAVRQFQRLVKEYARSRYLTDAYVNIGEYYFDNQSPLRALKAYKKATEDQSSSKYGFALYKLAWCYYNVQNYGEAIETMKRVIAFSKSGARQGDKRKVILYEESLKDIVRFFADAGEMDVAYRYFKKQRRPELILSMLRTLGATYFEDGKFLQAIKTYRRLIAEDKNSPSAPNYQKQIINAYKQMGKKDDTLKEISRLRKAYGKDSSWARANSSNADARRQARAYLEEALRQAANSYHKEARKLGNSGQAVTISLQAEKAYRIYLNDFPSEKWSYDMRYAFGELLFDLGDYYKKKGLNSNSDGNVVKRYYSDAFDEYSKVVQIDPKGKYAQTCAGAAVFAALEMVKREEKEGLIKKRRSATDLDIVELSPWEERLLISMQNFAKAHPASRDSIDYLYEAGELLFSKNRLDEAAERFQQVIAIRPSSKQASSAAIGIADALAFRGGAYFQRKDYAKALKDYRALEQAAQSFFDQKGLGNASFKQKMKGYTTLAREQIRKISASQR